MGCPETAGADAADGWDGKPSEPQDWPGGDALVALGHGFAALPRDYHSTVVADPPCEFQERVRDGDVGQVEETQYRAMVRRLTERSRAEQGLPPQVQDRAFIEWLVGMVEDLDPPLDGHPFGVEPRALACRVDGDADDELPDDGTLLAQVELLPRRTQHVGVS